MLEQAAHERFARILFRLVLLRGIRARQQRSRLEVNERRCHDEKLARHVEIQLLHQREIGEVLLGDQRDRYVVDVHLALANEMNQQIERPLERIELDLVRVRR
jgi:hypothetical protein